MSNFIKFSVFLGVLFIFKLSFASPTCFEVHNWTQSASIPMTINVTHTLGSSNSWGSGRSQTIHPGGWAAIGHYKNGTGNWPCPGQGFIIAGMQEQYHRHPCYAQFNVGSAFTIPGKYHIYNKDNVVYMVTPYFKKITLCYPHNGW